MAQLKDTVISGSLRVTDTLYANALGTTLNIKGKLIVNPSYDTASNSFNEGIRINQASNGWAAINFGSAADSTTSIVDGAWFIGRRGAAGSLVGAAGDFTIEEQTSTGSGLTIHKNSGGATLYIDKTSDFGLKILNAGAIPNNTWLAGLEVVSASMVAGSNLSLAVGQSASTKNRAFIGFHYAGNESNSNYLTLGLYNTTDVIKVFGDRTVDVSDSLVLHASDSASTQTKGINFKNDSDVYTHIGVSSASGAFGIYAKEKIYLRPGNSSTAINTDQGIVLSYSDLIPTQNNSVALGGSSNRWNGIYSTTGNFTGSITTGSITTGNLTIGGTVDTDAGKKISSSSTLYLNSGSTASVILSRNGTNYIRLDTNNDFRPEADNARNLGTASYRWANFYSSKMHPTLTATGVAAVTSSPYKSARWRLNLGITTPTDGDIVTFTVPVAGTTQGVYLTLNGDSAADSTFKPIAVSGESRLTSHYPVGTTISLVYDSDGAVADMYAIGGAASRSRITGGCWRILNYYDSGNTNDTSVMYIRAGNAVHKTTAQICRYVMAVVKDQTHIIPINSDRDGTTNNGTLSGHTITTEAFQIFEPFVYNRNNAVYAANASVAAGALWYAYAGIDLRYSFNITTSTFTAHKDVYIKAKLQTATTAKFDTTTPVTQTLPATNDGFIYIKLGRAYNGYCIDLTYDHPIYYHDGHGITQYVGAGATEIVNIVYPVGSIYMSTENTSPATLFGGTWEQLKDRFLLGAGDTYTAGGTGGAATVTLVENEIPSHNHTFTGTEVTSGENDANHSHTVCSHSHTVCSHSHTVCSHSHTVCSHSHTGPSHSHRSTGGGSFVVHVTSGMGGYATGSATSFGLRATSAATANDGTGSTGGSSPGTNGQSPRTNGASPATNGSSPATNTQSANHKHKVTAEGTIGNTGGGAAHNNMPPYLVVYMWKRTA